MTDSTELARPAERIADVDLASIASFADAEQVLNAYGFESEDFATTYGTGFKVLDTTEKSRLIGVPFRVLEWSFNVATKGGERFVSLALITETGEKLILNDGSTGICAQMEAVTGARLKRGADMDHATHALDVRGGLRMSTYPTKADGTPLTRIEQRDNPELAKGTGTTFYLAN